MYMYCKPTGRSLSFERPPPAVSCIYGPLASHHPPVLYLYHGTITQFIHYNYILSTSDFIHPRCSIFVAKGYPIQ